MKLSDFYNQKKIPVTSVNNKVGDVVLNASDVNAISKKDIGILVPTLKDGVVPDNQLPNYAKLVNDKIKSVNIPIATNDRVGGIILGQGFSKDQNGVVNAVGTVSKQQKQQKIDIIKTDGTGNSVLADNGEYLDIVQPTQTRIQFNELNYQNNVVFYGNLPIVSLLSQSGKYYILTSQDVTYNGQQTILHMTKYLILQGINQLNSTWVVFVASAVKYIDNNKKLTQCKNIALNQALIYS